MGNKNASSPRKQSNREQNEAQLFTPHAYRSSNSPDSGPSVSLAGEQEPVHSVTLLHSVQNALVSGGGGKTLTVCDWTNGTTLASLTGHTKDVTQVLGVHGPTSVYASSRDHNVYQWNVRSCDSPLDSQAPSAVYRGHEFVVTTIAGSTAQGEYLCSGSRDTSLRLWDTRTQQCIRQQAIARNLITHMVWPSEEHSLVQCSEDKTLRVWDTRCLQPVLQFPQCKNILSCCDCADGGRYIVTGQRGSDAGAVVWDVRAQRAVYSLHGHLSSITSCRFIPFPILNLLSEGTPPIVTCSQDGSIKLWDMKLANLDYSVEPAASHSVPGSGGLTSLEVLERNRIACSSLHVGVSVWDIGSNGNFSLKAQY